MILVDTSIWVDHLRRKNAQLAELLNAGRVLVHPFVIGEIALGNLRERKLILAALSDLPHAAMATDEEVRSLIERHALLGRGIGYIDAHLVAAVQLTAGATVWTRDTRLHAIADELSLALELR